MRSATVLPLAFAAGVFLCLGGASAVQANGWEHAAVPYAVLVRALREGQAETRRQAALSLGVRGQLEALEPLRDALDRPEPDGGVRAEIYLAIARLAGDAELSRLGRCLEDEPEAPVRGSCATAIGLAGGEEALGMLLAVLAARPGALVQARVIDALGRFRDRRAVSALQAVLPAGQADPGWARVVRALGRTTSAAAAPILLGELRAARTRHARMLLLRARARAPNPLAAPYLAELLATETDPELRAALVLAIGTSRGEGSLEVLVGMLEDGERLVMSAAAEALEDLGRPEASPAIAALAVRLSEGLRRSRKGTHDAASLALDALDARDALARLELLRVALRACVTLDAGAAQPAFLAAAPRLDVERGSARALRAAEEVYETRRLALYGLGYANEADGAGAAAPRAASMLAGPDGAGDPDPRLRAVAVRSLGVLGQPDSLRLVSALAADDSAEVRWTVAMVLGRLGDRDAAPALLEGLGDRSAEVRRQAALGLGYLGVPDARARLRALAGTDPDARVREAAALAASLLDG